MVTWFQFHSYLQRQSVSDLEKHLIQLTKEGRVRSWQWPGSKLQPTLGTLSLLAWAQTRCTQLSLSRQSRKREVNSLEQPQGEEVGAVKSALLVSF